MRVSVVVPAYNEEKYIATCLQNLLDQDIPADEIIVVDNNSTDNTVEIASKYPVTIIHERTQGMTPCRNAGFNFANFEIIARTDADSRVPKNWIEEIKHAFLDENIDAISGPSYYYDLPLRTKLFFQFYFFISSLYFGQHILYGPNIAITKKIWQKIKQNICNNDSLVHEDIDLALHIVKMGGKIKIDNHLIVGSSGRRIINNPRSFFTNYATRYIKMRKLHKGNL